MDSELLKRLWPVFVEEAREHLLQISAAVLELEKDPARRPAGLLESVRRTAHSLKGSSASLGFDHLEQMAHGLEDALAGFDPSGVLPSAVVEAALRVVEVLDAALALGDAGLEPQVRDLDEELASLARAAALRRDAPPARAAQSALHEVWPVFRGEVQERVASLRAFVAQGGAWTPVRCDAVADLLHNLKGSASVLALPEMERLVGALEEALGAVRTAHELAPDLKEAVDKAIEGLQATIDDVDERMAPAPPPPPPAGSAASAGLLERFRTETLEDLAAFEDALLRLCAPGYPGRGDDVDDTARRAHTLKGSAGAVRAPKIAELAERIEAEFGLMREPGPQESRAAAALASLLVELRELVRALGAPEGSGGRTPAAPPPPQAAPEPHPQPLAGGVDRMLRVSVKTLDSLALQMEHVALGRARQERRVRELAQLVETTKEVLLLCEEAASELRVAREGASPGRLGEGIPRLRQLQRDLARFGQDASREAEQLKLVSTIVREDLRDLRMIPASFALEPLRRTVREVIGRVGKQVELRLTGGDVRLDRRILDELKGPLLHLVRNAVDHGIESPQARREAGKPEAGQLEVRVEQRGHRVAVTVADDGAGLPIDRIRATALTRGLLTSEAAQEMPDAELARLVFRSGFSTAREVTALSGRGVGLDIVKETATRLQGTVDVDWTPGRGTRFVLDLPLTLAATLGVVVRVGSDLVALPAEAVERILRVPRKELGTVAGQAMLRVGDAQVPFTSLSQALGLGQTRLTLDAGGGQPCLLLALGDRRMAVAVDEVVAQQELVVHPLGRHLSRAPHLAGATVLDDGRVAAMLHPAEVLQVARPAPRGKVDEGSRPRILVADDSLTTRSAMKAVLEIAGFSVLAAADGDEALQLLADSPCQLIVTDVQMPRLDGLSLTRRIKSDPRLASIPVILVTSLDAAADRAAGLAAGADGYLVKREVERGKLLELVRQLLPGGAA